MRTPQAIAIGVLVGAAPAVAAFMGVDRFGIPVANGSAPLPVATTAQVEPLIAMPQTPSMAVPTTPQYRPLAESPPAIYRYPFKGSTTYSNEPCSGGSVVNESSAVIGYDTRPNDLRSLDELRLKRQDIRTSMARLHC